MSSELLWWLAEFAAHCITIGQPVQIIRGDTVREAFAEGIGGESARSAKCLSHLKHLATAVNSCAMTTGWYPLAGSIEIFAFDESGGVNNIKDIFGERRGWISWNSQGAYKSKPTSHVANSGWFTSAYEQRRPPPG